MRRDCRPRNTGVAQERRAAVLGRSSVDQRAPRPSPHAATPPGPADAAANATTRLASAADAALPARSLFFPPLFPTVVGATGPVSGGRGPRSRSRQRAPRSAAARTAVGCRSRTPRPAAAAAAAAALSRRARRMRRSFPCSPSALPTPPPSPPPPPLLGLTCPRLCRTRAHARGARPGWDAPPVAGRVGRGEARGSSAPADGVCWIQPWGGRGVGVGQGE